MKQPNGTRDDFLHPLSSCGLMKSRDEANESDVLDQYCHRLATERSNYSIAGERDEQTECFAY